MEHRPRKPTFRFQPPRMHGKPTKAVQLVLHTEVDYVYRQGLGIGIVQQAERMMYDGAKRSRTNHVSPTKEQKFSIKREFFRAQNVKTERRAYMLALLHALGMAYDTVRKNGTKESSCVDEIVITTSSPTVVEAVNHHIQNAPKSLKLVTKMKNRLMIERVVKAVKKKLFRRGVNISIVVADEHDTAVKRARTLARQRGSNACKSRRQRTRAQSDDPTEDPGDPEMEAS
jgi:ribonuclease HI